MRFERRDVAVVEQDLAFDGTQQTRQRAHDRGFAGTVGADHRHHLTGPHLQ
jgi:hypothetical protein